MEFDWIIRVIIVAICAIAIGMIPILISIVIYKIENKPKMPKTLWEDYHDRGIIGDESYNLIIKGDSSKP